LARLLILRILRRSLIRIWIIVLVLRQCRNRRQRQRHNHRQHHALELFHNLLSLPV
jgi:hypothetical protein